jgi:hypothetical protein
MACNCVHAKQINVDGGEDVIIQLGVRALPQSLTVKVPACYEMWQDYFQNKLERRIFSPNRQRKTNNAIVTSPNVISAIKSKRMEKARLATRHGRCEMPKQVVRKSEGVDRKTLLN